MNLVGVLLCALFGVVTAFDLNDYPVLGCEKPTLKNGYIKNGKEFYAINEKIEFACNKPYTLIGHEETKCRAEPVKIGGRVAYIPGVRPYKTVCVACATPGAPANGSIDEKDDLFSVGVTVNWKCDTGYELIGASKATCQDNGGFDKKKPICKLVQCKNPGAPDKGEVDPVKPFIDYPKSISWKCDKGYNLIGKTKATCQANGKFDNIKPFCKLVQCKNPGAPDKGEVDPVKTLIDYSKSISWTCDIGYNLIGKTKATCQADGNFDEEKPICKPIYCYKPDPPKHGSVSPKDDKIFYGNSYTFECDKGYKLVGDLSRKCLLSGKLGGKTPVCIRVKCKNLGAPVYGSVNPSDETIDYGVTITWSCLPFLELKGAETAICQQNGKFSKAKPVCKPKKGCSKLPVPLYGKMEKEKVFYELKESVNFTCTLGQLRGSSMRTCIKNRVWDGEETTCDFDVYNTTPGYGKK